MSATTIRPSATIASASLTLTGAATVHGALSDQSDASYVVLNGGFARVSMGTPSIPAGALIKNVAVGHRMAAPDGFGVLQLFSTFGAVATYEYDIGVSWTVPTDGGVGLVTGDAVDETLVLFLSGQGTYNPAGVKVYELYADITYVVKPVVTPSAPTGTLTTTTSPIVTWADTLDSAGGGQSKYQVRVFTDAVYGAGGFNAATSTAAADSGQLNGTVNSWHVDEILADDTYRAYVRVAQDVEGTDLWSDWAYTQFTISASRPGNPTLTVTHEDAKARIKLLIASNSGAATTTDVEAQRSVDGGQTWQAVRILAGATGFPRTIYDYEAPPGVAVSYRARALHYDATTASYVSSAWVTAASSWATDVWWLKHPNRPSLNTTVTMRGLPDLTRAGRQGVFQALGSSTALVITDTRGPVTGTVTLRSDTIAAQHMIDALLDEHAPLLLQGPENAGAPGYLTVTNHVRSRIVAQRQDASQVWETLEFVSVDAPAGDVTDATWPT